MGTLAIQAEYITLAHALKASGFAGSGGQAKQLVRAGDVAVNGVVEIRPGRKLHAGDRFNVQGQPEWRVTR